MTAWLRIQIDKLAGLIILDELLILGLTHFQVFANQEKLTQRDTILQVKKQEILDVPSESSKWHQAIAAKLSVITQE